jgi:hypothetical protein
MTMEIDYRKYASPGEIDGVIEDLRTEMRAHQTEGHLCRMIGEAITHLEFYRNLLRRAYIEQLNRDKFSRIQEIAK